jgi:hypothetical protein
MAAQTAEKSHAFLCDVNHVNIATLCSDNGAPAKPASKKTFEKRGQ